MGGKLITDRAVCKLIAKTVPAHLANTIAPEMKLRTHLGIDSIGLISMVIVLEEGLGLDLFRVSDQITQAASVADVIAIVKACAEDRA